MEATTRMRASLRRVVVEEHYGLWPGDGADIITTKFISTQPPSSLTTSAASNAPATFLLNWPSAVISVCERFRPSFLSESICIQLILTPPVGVVNLSSISLFTLIVSTYLTSSDDRSSSTWESRKRDDARVTKERAKYFLLIYFSSSTV